MQAQASRARSRHMLSVSLGVPRSFREQNGMQLGRETTESVFQQYTLIVTYMVSTLNNPSKGNWKE